MPKIGTILPIFIEKSGVGYPYVVSQHTKDVNIASLDYVRAFFAAMRPQIVEFDELTQVTYFKNSYSNKVGTISLI